MPTRRLPTNEVSIMKKKYKAPELDVIRFQLDSNILLGSIEKGQNSSANGVIDDNGSEPIIVIGGLE